MSVPVPISDGEELAIITSPTFQEQAVNVGALEGCLTKNVFLRDKKYGLFLVTIKSTRDVNMKTMGNLLGLSGSNLRFGDDELLLEKLKIPRGSVSPFALLNDTAKDVTYCIDNELLEQPFINIHPLRCDQTTSITPKDLLAFLEHVGHQPTLLNFPTD